ncbi:MFS transporter [Dactylosporangium darangshiense]|uniref:MFS transporter n=2 Tax=Dactylosporangium darangshiense TaxID=579108 RepID=A0ABP8CUZ7_9ACTN
MTRDFRLLLGAGLVSLTGDWIMRVGLTYAVYELTGSTLASAGALLASLVPQFVLGSIAGVFVDRWERRRVMVVTNLLLAVGLLPLLGVQDRGDVWIVYLVTAVQSGLGQFFIAAEAAVIPRLVDERDLVAANAFNGQVRDVARLVGAAVGGVVAGLGGISLLAVVDMVSFGLAAGTLLLIRTPTGHGQRQEKPHLLREWADGARVAVREPTLRVVLLFVVMTGVGEAVMGSLMAPFVRGVLHADAAVYGLIMAVQAGGGIAGGLAAAAFGHRVSPRRLVGYGALAFGGLDLLLFLYPLVFDAWWPALPIMLVVGLPGAFMLAGLLTLFQTHSDDAYRGRLFGVFSALEAGAMLVGALAAGVLGDQLGIVPVIAAQGAQYCLAGGLVLLLLTTQRKLVEAEA